MPQAYQTYVTQISNGFPQELPAIDMLEHFVPISIEMSKMALSGLQSGMKKEKLNSVLQKTFGVNKRHANSVIAFVVGEVDSAKKCHERHIETLDAKIKSIKEGQGHLEERLKSHRDYVAALQKYHSAIKSPSYTKTGKPKQVARFTKKPEFDEACPLHGKTHGKTYLQLAKQHLHQKKRLLKMYDDRRKSVEKAGVQVNLGKTENISCVGSTGETGGNQICQFQPGIIPLLKIRVPYFMSCLFGEYVELPLYKFNQHGRDEILTAWATNRALSYVFSRNVKGLWVVAITTLVEFEVTSNDYKRGCIGLDINPGSIGWCATNSHGNPIAWGKINLDVHSCSTEQTEARLSDAVTEITQRALASNKPIVIENLDFSEKKKQLKKGRKSNRMLSGFAYAKFFELLKYRCFKRGIRVIEVSPKYSSQIGIVKYMRRYGMGSDSAAGLVLARRGMGIYYEVLPARYALQTSVRPAARKHVFAHWQKFNRHYKNAGSRNAWFATPNLTGSTGESLVDTGGQETTLAQAQGGECKPRQAVKVRILQGRES